MKQDTGDENYHAPMKTTLAKLKDAIISYEELWGVVPGIAVMNAETYKKLQNIGDIVIEVEISESMYNEDIVLNVY